MIEPDINEQLGSLAPSQGNADLLQNVVSQESLSMTEAITPRRSFVLPTAPPQPQLDPALKAAVDEMASQRSAVLNSSLYNATKKNPDTVAEAQRVGKQMGVGADIAERNLAELQRGAMMLKALDRNLAISAPKTANSLTEPDFANIAYDDLENLTGTEKLMNWFAGTDFFKGAQGTFISTEMATIDQLNSEGMATSKDFERYRELQRDLQIVGQPAPYSISGNIANLLASVEAGAEIGAQYAVTGAVLGGAAGAIGGPLAPATMPAGMALGGTAGFATGMAKWMYQSMAGESYRQLREGEVSHEVALPMSRGIGVITSALEFAGLGAELYIASGVGKKIFAKELATDVTAELSKQMIKKATASEAVWDASKLYFGEILTESTVEGLQTAITRVGTEIGRAYDRPDLQNMFQTPEGRRAIISEAVDSFVNVAIGMSVAGLPLPAANYYMDRGRYADAKRSQQFYEDLSKNAVDSKMRQRNPDAAERFYADQVDGTGAETSFVDGRLMQNILNQSGLTNEQVDTVLPGIRQQLAEAISTGGDVTIPTATYAARLAGTRLGDLMKMHMRPNANAWSADTAAKYAGQLKQEKEKALALLEEKETTDTKFVDEARVIEKDMQEKLVAVGRDPKLAKAEATIFRDMMVVAAAEAKMTPAAYMAQHGPDVVGPQAQAASLEQAAKLTLANVEQSFADLGVEQRLSETATTIRPGIIRVPTELRDQGRAATAMQSLLYYADQSGKRIDISPTDEFGANKKRLVAWYKSLGFVENKGKNKDFAISATMYREPRGAAFEQASRIDLGLDEQVAFDEANQRPEVVAWAKEKFGDRTAPDGSSVWQNFTEWFGDSKTVDAEGKPVMVYHGTDKKFTKVNMKKGAQGVFWVASDKSAIESGEAGAARSGVIMELFVSIKNPAGWNEYDNKSIAELIRDGYDGVILRDKDGSFNAIAFTPTQIKSAGENVGTFSKTDASLLKQAAISKMNPKYMAAVKRGDMETAQQMVIEAANAAGYTTLAHHGTDSDPFDVFESADEYNWGQASYFSPNLEYATMYSEISRTGRGKPRVLNVALDLGKTFSPETNKEHLKLYRQWAREQERAKGHGAFYVNGPIKGPYGPTKARNVIDYQDQWWIVQRIWEAGFDSFTTSESDGQTLAWGVRVPNQIKLIDPVTRDESGKIIPLSKRFNFKSPSILEQAAYRGEHTAPTNDGYAQPLSNLGGIFPDDIYSQDAARLYGTGNEQQDRQAISIIQSARGKPNQSIKIYRAVPLVLSNAEKIADIETQKAEIQRRGYERWAKKQENPLTYDQLNAELDRLKSLPEEAAVVKPQINNGDWVTISKQYAVEHGESALNGNYKIVTKTVPVKHLFTDGNSIQEWGYDSNPQGILEQAAMPAQPSYPVLAEAWNKYLDGEEYGTTNDLADTVEGLIDSDEAPQGLADALDQFREEQAYDREVGGRGDMDTANKEFESAVQAAAEQMKTPQMLEQASRIDADYMAAVERGDMETAQRMVDEAAKAAGEEVLFRATEKENEIGIKPWASFTPEIETAIAYTNNQGFGGSIIRAIAVKDVNIFDVDVNDFTDLAELIGEEDPYEISRDWVMNGWRYPWEESSKIQKALANTQYDAIRYKDDFPDGATTIVFVRDYESKSADPITRDAAGNVIPLSRRFNIASPSILEQAAVPGPARGGYDPKRIQILLNSQADAFTFLHELMHWRMDKMIQSVNNGKASPQEIADLDIMIQSFKLGGESQQERLAIWNAMTFEEQRPHWEAIAYNFENYLFEGKAPSVEMQGVFDRLASFIKRVYVSIRDDLNKIYRREFGKDLPVLTDEVRGVMDRMLASEDQIKRKQAMMQMVPMFLTQEEATEQGMDEATYAAYQAMNKEAEDAAVTDLTKASLKQMQWLSGARSRVLKELQAKHDALRKEIRAEVKAEVDAEPIYAAMSILKTGEGRAKNGEMVKFDDKFKLNLESVKKMIPAEDVAKLGFGKYGMVAADGMDPDMAADMFGFSSGDELVLALLSAKPAKEEINARTDKRMMDENGDMNTPQSQEEAVQRALHNEARFRFNAVEVRWLSKATSPVRVFMDAAKLAAQQIIAGKVIRDLRPSEYQAAEAKAAREAADAHNKRRTAAQAAQAAATKERNAGLSGVAAGVPMSEVEAAAAAKGQEAAQKATERESERKARYGERTPEQVILRAKQIQLLQNQLAREAQDAKDEVSKGVKYLRNVLKAKNVQRMGADIADQVTNMLERFSLANISVEEAGKRLSLAKWIEGQLELGIVPDIDPKLLDESFRKPYQQMTVSEFRDLVSSIQQLEYIGKHENEIRLAGEKVQFVDARDAIVKSIQEEKKDGKKLNPRTATTKNGRALEGIRTFMAAHLKVAAIARIMDGGKDNGKVWNYFIRSANAAGDMETRMIGEATEKVMNILKPVKALGNMEGGRVYFKSIDRSLNRGERFVIALNSGNEGNLQRMRDGEGWTMEQLAPVLESLSSTEWNAVQAIWNHFETYKPLVEAKERRLYGKAPNWIEVKPFAIKTSDGKTLNLEGGYYPIKYDPKASDAAEQFTDAETAKAQMKGAFTAATTRRSYVKNRAERVVGRPLMLTMTGVYSGLGEVIHDLSWHEWLISANRMMKDRGFSSTVNETYGPEIKRQMKDWIKDVAAGQGAADQGAANFATWMRRSISSARLGFNVTSGIMQVSGFANTWVRIDGTLVPKWTAIGVGSFVLHPKKMMSMIQEKSSMMRNLGRTQFRDLNEIRNTMQDKDGKWNAIHANAYIFCKVMQSMVNYPTWAGAYEKALFEGNNEDTSIALADQAVIDSQGGGQLKDLASVERGGAWSKLFTVFYGYQNALFNSMATSVMTQKKSTAAAQLTLLVAVPAVYKYYVNQAIKAKRKDDDDNEEKGLAAFVAEESIQTMLSSMVGIRELSNLAKFDAKEVRDYSGPSGLAMFTDITNVYVQTSQYEWDAAYRRALLNLAGDLFGIPAVQINRTIDGIQLMIDKNNADLRAPIFGTRR